MDEVSSPGLLAVDFFAPMSEEEIAHFEDEMTARNQAEGADKISLKNAVKEVTEDFDHFFEGGNRA
jgi:hypothetical protein